MSEQDQNQSGNRTQISSDSQIDASSETAPPTPQAVEPTPKPEPSFGTHLRSDPGNDSQTVKTDNKSE